MKTLKSLALFAGLALITARVSAQEKSPMEQQQTAQMQTDQVKKNVKGVTPDEESKILTVEQEHAKNMDDARISSNGDKAIMKSKKKQICDSRDGKIKTILTDAQYTQYLKMVAAHKEENKQGM